MVENDDKVVSETAQQDGGISKKRRARNLMVLGLILGLVAIIWVVTMLKVKIGAS